MNCFSDIRSGGRRRTRSITALQVKPYLVLQPTIQYFDTIGGNPNRPSGLVIGLRTGVRF